MQKLAQVMLIVILAIVGVAGSRWYRYVSNTASPYDEVGITLNTLMPPPLRKWGCDRLHATFGNVLPPHGCAVADGRQWM